MFSRNENIIIEKYTQDIKRYYYDHNILDHLTIIEENPNIIDPKQIAIKISLPFDMFEENVYVEFSRIIQGMQMTEFQYVIDELQKGKINYIEYNVPPNKKIIDEAILLLPQYKQVDYMIVPISFFMDMHKWGMPIDSLYHIITYDNNYPYYNILGEKIKILWSNKFIKLNNIIIGSKNDNLWQYKPDDATNERLTVNFSKENNKNILLLKTIFKFIPANPEYISIIKFPEELIKI